jgi:hypothetical protein
MTNIATLSVAPKVDALARAREVGPALAAAADEIERTQEIPEPALGLLHGSQLFRMLLPKSVGGDQLEPWLYLRAVEEIARHEGSLDWNLFVANSSALIAPFIPLESARAIYGDPRGLISWGPPNQHRATAVPGGYRVTGEWHFSSGYRQANWIGAHCHVVEPDGSLRLNRFGRPTVRTLLMPKAETTPIHDWHTLGMRGTASEGYSVRDVFVPNSPARARISLRRRGPLPPSPCRATPAVSGVALGRRAPCTAFMELAVARRRATLGAWPTARRQAEWRGARRAGIGARRWLILQQVWATADDVEPIAQPTGRRPAARRPCHTEAADGIYKAAGTSAIFTRHAVRAALPRHPHALPGSVADATEAVRVMFSGSQMGRLWIGAVCGAGGPCIKRGSPRRAKRHGRQHLDSF